MRLHFLLPLLSVALAPAGCSSREPRDDSAMRLEWFFANGADCGANHVDEIVVRGNPTGGDAVVLRAPCGDGEAAFPPSGKLTEGTWILQATALDANGQSCFEDDVERLVVAAGDEPSLRLIFHRAEGRASAACADVGEDVDGGVPDPDVDGGGGGEGEGEGEVDDFLSIELRAADIEDTCATVAACGYGGALGRAPSCATTLAGAVAGHGRVYGHESVFRVVACAREHRDCDTFLDCATFGIGPQACGLNDGSTTCSGDVAVTCFGAVDGQATIFDCGAIGGVCDGDGCTTGEECVIEDIFDAASCEDRSSFVCVDGKGYIGECPPGTACNIVVSGVGPWPYCEPYGIADCSTPDACVGDVWQFCDGGVTTKIESDCAAADQRCADGTGCVPAADECDTGTPTSCDGAVLDACINGRVVHIDCADHGRAACENGAQGATCG